MSLEIIEATRGISVDTLEGCGVYWQDGDDYAVRVPYYNYTGVWYERKLKDPTLDIKPKVLSPPNAERHLYNPLRIGPNAGLLILCEGEYDTLSAIDAGFDAVGTQGAKTFNSVWARLYSGANVIIAFDADTAGSEAAYKVRSFFQDLGSSNAYMFQLDEGKDLNDLHKAGELASRLNEFIQEQGIDYE